MEVAYYEDEFKKERRARLAAERLLEQKQSQLKAANRKLSQQALRLSEKIVDQRKVLDQLQDENSEATAQSLKASHKALAAERLLWDAIKSIRDGFALFDKDRKLIVANAPYLNLFKTSQNVGPGISMESILELCLQDNLIDRGDLSEDEWYDFMLDRWKADRIKPITLELHNGVYVNLVDRRTADGGIVSLALNITDTIRREEELREARDTAQTADRAKSAFLAKMSHEFRTPINGVVGMADLLLDRAKDDDTKLYANTIKSSGQTLLSFVNTVLEYAMIENDEFDLQIAPFDTKDLIDAVQSAAPSDNLSENVEVIFDVDPNLPSQLLGDKPRLGQIVSNLYSNAITNTATGFVTVRMNWVDRTDQTQLVIAVEDTGCGIPEGKIDHIFGGFNQTDDSKSRSHDGAGLGLSIVNELVDKMGGTLLVTSIEDRGSQFEVVIPISNADPAYVSKEPDLSKRTALLISTDPLARAALSRACIRLGLDVDEAETIPSALPNDIAIAFVDAALVEKFRGLAPGCSIVSIDDGSSNSGIKSPYRTDDIAKHLNAPAQETRKKRILAAEDNKTNQLVFQKMLQDQDVEVVLVENGLEVVDAFKSFQPDLIFMDISMPKMDGMEATQQIRWHEVENGLESIPIVAMTAHALEGDEARIQNCGIDHYMVKPLNKSDIVAMISNTGLMPSAKTQKSATSAKAS